MSTGISRERHDQPGVRGLRQARATPDHRGNKKLFLSAVSSEFNSYRNLLAGDFKRPSLGFAYATGQFLRSLRQVWPGGIRHLWSNPRYPAALDVVLGAQDYRVCINSMVAGQHTFSREADFISALAHNHAAIFALRSVK
jgi:hypothetical protein